VKTPDGTISKLSSSLDKKNIAFLRSVAVNADHDIVIQLDEDNRVPVRANTWAVLTHQRFTVLKITVTQSTSVYAFGCTDADAIVTMVGEVTVSLGKVRRKSIVSDADTNFTDELSTYAIETENLTGLSDNKIMITGISVQSVQPLNYYLLFFGTDAFVGDEFDLTHFIGFEQLDLSLHSFQIGADGRYYYSLESLAIEYEDEDETNELHVALLNMDESTKNAGETGAIVLRFMYSPRM